MGNLVDSGVQPAEEPSTGSQSSIESLEFNADEIIIDLDAPEYHEYLKHKRKLRRELSRSEGNLTDEISYLQWMKTNSIRGSQINLSQSSQEESLHLKAARRRSAPVTGNEIYVTKKHSEEYEKRALGSKQRIKDIKKKYNLQDRDYHARTYLWNEEDEKQIQKEREERRRLRQEVRNKYNLPKPSHHMHRIIKAATG